MSRFFLASFVALAACSSSHGARRGGDGGIDRTDGSFVRDAGGRDAGEGVDAGDCAIDCAAPPPGCRYEGEGSCFPPRCPTLVCDEVACGTGMDRFPDFDRDCATADDCVVGNHLTDCCGSIYAMGIAASESDRFAEAEATCDAMYPGCGCASNLMTADDGTESHEGSPPTLLCMAGVCTTTFAPPP